MSSREQLSAEQQVISEGPVVLEREAPDGSGWQHTLIRVAYIQPTPHFGITAFAVPYSSEMVREYRLISNLQKSGFGETGTITFVTPDSDAPVTIRPIELDDAAWLFPNEYLHKLETLRSRVDEQLRRSGQQPPSPSREVPADE